MTEVNLLEAESKGRVIISKDFMFEAAHVLPKHPGKCRRLHGHSWKLTVAVDGLVNPDNGFVVDYALLKTTVNTHIIDVVDHQFLGQGEMTSDEGRFTGVLGYNFYPSSENLLIAFNRVLIPLIPELGKPWQQVKLHHLIINETCTSACEWRRTDGQEHIQRYRE